MGKLKKYFTVETITTGGILVFIMILAADGIFIKKLSSSAMAFPGFVFGTGILIGILDLIKSIREIKNKSDAEKQPLFENKKNFQTICFLMLLYVVLMWLCGFIISSMVFSLLFAWKHHYKRMILFTIVMAVIILIWYLLFTKFLGVQFPAGFIFELIFG